MPFLVVSGSRISMIDGSKIGIDVCRMTTLSVIFNLFLIPTKLVSIVVLGTWTTVPLPVKEVVPLVEMQY